MRASQATAGGVARTAPRSQRGIAARLLSHEHSRATLVLGLVVLIYLWPALISGELLSPVAALYEFAPWRTFTPSDLASFNNPLLIDVPGAVLPWQDLARELIHAGVFPAWNPYALAGTPFFANPQLAWFSPFTAISWIVPLHYALGLVAALKLLAAGLGSYLLARELRLGFWPGVLAGVSFAFCAFNIVWLTHSAQVSVAATLPWLVLLVERIVRTGRTNPGIALALVAAVAFSGGHPGTEVHVMTAAIVYALVRAGTNLPGIPPVERLRRLGIVAAALAVGALLLAVVLVPGGLASQETVGAAARAHGGSKLGASNLPFGSLRTAVFPDWWGRPSDGNSRGPSNYNERTLYAGVIALMLAVFSLTRLADWRPKLPFVVLAGLGLAVPFRAPVLFWLSTNLPVYRSVSYQRMLLLFMFAVAMLAAFGLHALLEGRRSSRDMWEVVVGGAVVGLAAIALPQPTRHELAVGLGHVFTGGGTGKTLLVVTSAGVLLLFVAGMALAQLALRWRPQARPAIVAAIVLLAAIDMLHFAHGYQPMAPAGRAIPPRTPAVRYLQRHAADGRVAGVSNALINDWTTVYRLRDVRGHDVPQPDLRYYHLWKLASPNQRAGPPLGLGELTRAQLPALSVLGARFLVFDPRRDQERQARATLGLPSAYRGRDAVILENPSALPRALVAPAVRLVGNEQAALDAIARPEFDARREAIVERGQPGAARLARTGPVHGRAWVVREGNSEVVLRAALDRPGLVVLDDHLTPGWSVEVDGRRADVVRVDSVLRGVAVAAGAHTVTWSYAVPGLRRGLALSGVGLVALLGWALIALRRRT